MHVSERGEPLGDMCPGQVSAMFLRSQADATRRRRSRFFDRSAAEVRLASPQSTLAFSRGFGRPGHSTPVDLAGAGNPVGC